MIVLAVLFATAVFLLSLRHAHAAAATFTVNSLADPGEGICDIAPDGCTLHEAIFAANTNPGAEINFDLDFSVPETINLTVQLPVITEAVRINGPGANLLTVRRSDDGGDYRIFTVTTPGVVTFSGITISNGASLNLGGGIENGSAGTVIVINCTLDSNSAGSGGGIYNAGTLKVSQSTLTNNNAAGLGGGIYNSGSELSVTNSTLSGNFAGIGGAIFNEGTTTVTSSTLSNNGAGQAGGIGSVGPFYLDSSIVALNNAQGPPHDISGVVTSQDYNAVGSVDNKSFIVAVHDQVGVTAAQLNLGPLQNNEGPTHTIELCMGSVAIDKGDNTVFPGLRTDQRGTGFSRRIRQVDVGAYEVRGVARLCP